jgi:GTPase Era involved in 16S rRNA processing
MGIFRSKPQTNVICVGLDNSGKSTLINFLKPPADKVRIQILALNTTLIEPDSW